jgi:hypothetical protein
LTAYLVSFSTTGSTFLMMFLTTYLIGKSFLISCLATFFAA